VFEYKLKNEFQKTFKNTKWIDSCLKQAENFRRMYARDFFFP
jgi:hypothetical protein